MPNMNTNPSVEQLENTISAYINSVYKDVPPTEEEFKEKADLMRASMAAIMPISDLIFQYNMLKAEGIFDLEQGKDHNLENNPG